MDDPTCRSIECVEMALGGKRISDYVFLATLTVTCFDHFLTLPLEVKYVWPSRLSIVNVVYFITKYGTWLELAFDTFRQFGPIDAGACHSTMWITGYSYDILTWVAEALVGAHVLAVWGRDRRLTFAMPIAFTALFTTSLVTMDAALKDFIFIDPPISVGGCFLVSVPTQFFRVIILVMIWTSSMYILLVIPAIQAYKDGHNSSFVKAIYRDGMLYYIYLFLLHTGNLIAVFAGPYYLLAVLTYPSRALQVAFTTRILLHTRQQANRNPDLFIDSTGEEH